MHREINNLSRVAWQQGFQGSALNQCVQLAQSLLLSDRDTLDFPRHFDTFKGI